MPNTIVRAAIYPGIGIARVGNSEKDFYIGPEVTDPPAAPLGFYRDPTGAIKREAARFRIYGYDAQGAVVAELTQSDTVKIGWTVHLANRKAAWYQWQIAMDIPDAATTVLPLRNAKVTGADRAGLTIDAGAKSISGAGAAAVTCAGKFVSGGVTTDVPIGVLRTDDAGRLLVLGAQGVSASPTGQPIFNPNDGNSFINADGWYDDTCDGTIDATVTIGGQSIPVESAWVVTAPPNYGPQLKAVRTLYDLLHDLYIQAGWMPKPGTPSFTHDIYPILHRLTDHQWVNQGFAGQFGGGAPYNFADPALIARLAAKAPSGRFDPNAEFRRQIFNAFRPTIPVSNTPVAPTPGGGNPMQWPWIYGDAMDRAAYSNNARQNSSITATQSAALAAWVAGDFIADWGQTPSPPRAIEDVPLADQPAMLNRAAMDFCLADAFHPGCELTWPMRHLSMYASPFRLNRRPAGTPEPNYGPTLNQTQALAANGPLHAQGPGDVNRWMGLPWQADTGFCRGGYDTTYDPFVPTFWPARVPNEVLTLDNYAIAVNTDVPMPDRIAAFSQRMNWNAPLTGTTAEQMEQMVKIFGSMGLLEVWPGVEGNGTLPAKMMVASFGPGVYAAPARLSIGEPALKVGPSGEQPVPTPVRHNRG
jgi:hypothetical protein